ncbi:TPA: ABC transporter ATP-binding protein [Candidatus Dependentiae bacterium]|nr:MAG: Organic solvent tolerance ABC transporter, ATP-binding protein [candidate division TM6 bacterium GW2011_GWE2_31_21]KKP53252.1 MAG: Organic solvent tolerance ABC transporter, ATP-binding protein [candidate division TM6 bacterium GW2011_GWF2_33_332]HBS48049.1 ABC transporter ATP-binding protein [Candidatus Dependentiae bacterium]HBZ73348.1 ABC transporter ATP-binding protein [Candidatus Dependentiae bacterium]
MIELIDLKKSFGAKKIIDGVNLQINSGEFLAIIGRSGEGKSVLLKQIIGLIKPDSGQVIIDGEDITKLTKHEREKVYKKCGYVFQFAALLDSLNVFENVGISPIENEEDLEKVKLTVLKRIKDVGLSEDTLYKYPHELSGGMKKRVGLARTLMLNPQIIIYDEPTTGLDPITVRLIHELIKQTQIKFKTTSIVISHDIEIFKYADRVAMLHGGKIVFVGDAKTIWESKNPYIYQFIRGLTEGPIVNR